MCLLCDLEEAAKGWRSMLIRVRRAVKRAAVATRLLSVVMLTSQAFKIAKTQIQAADWQQMQQYSAMHSQIPHEQGFCFCSSFCFCSNFCFCGSFCLSCSFCFCSSSCLSCSFCFCGSEEDREKCNGEKGDKNPIPPPLQDQQLLLRKVIDKSIPKKEIVAKVNLPIYLLFLFQRCFLHLPESDS